MTNQEEEIRKRNEENIISWSPVAGVNTPPKEEEKEEKGLLSYRGMSPLAMGLLQAGASMMRQSGWRNRPVTTGEMIGHAIPAGIQGYNQEMMIEQQELAQQQALEQERQQQEQLRIQEQQKQNEIIEIIAQVQTAPITNKEKTEIIAYLKSSDPQTRQLGLKRFEKLRDEKSEVKPHWERVEVFDSDGSTRLKFVDLNAKGGIEDILTKTAPESVTRKQLEYMSEKIATSYPAFKDKAEIVLTQPDLSVAYKNMQELVKELPAIPSEIAPEKYKEKADAIYNIFKNKKYLGETGIAQLDTANSSVTEKERYEKLHAFGEQWGAEGYKKLIAEDRLDLDYDKFEFSQEKFEKETENWDITNTQKLMQQAIENGWNKKKIQREIVMHNARLGQMAKAQEDGTQYLEKEEFEKQFGKMPAGAFVAEIKDGQLVKFKKDDFSDLTPPKYSEEDMKVLEEELNALYVDYPQVFGEKEKRGISITLMTSDPAGALKEAHDILTAEKKTITPPASILKKYQSDIAVIKNAKEALNLLEDEKVGSEVEGGTGFVWGRVTEKFKNEFYQEFKALATMASLTKRHELIGSQMTDGELRFTESLFPSPQDTLTSVRKKLQTLLKDAKYNVSITKNMFTEEAGYNPKVFNITPRYSNGKITFEGGDNQKPINKEYGEINQTVLLDNEEE